MPLRPLELAWLAWVPLEPVLSACLEDAKEPTRFVPGLDGDVPLRIWSLKWLSASLVESVYLTLAREVLGFHVEASGNGMASASGMYALAGCEDPENYLKCPNCNGKRVEYHLVMEVWEPSHLSHLRLLQESMPEHVPEDLGSVGYPGMHTIFVLGNTSERAYRAEGLALDFYRSYNATWHKPWLYFDALAAIPSDELRPCNKTVLMDKVEMGNYVRSTGDLDGVRLRDGRWEGLCQGRWWLAPACRSRPETCVPLIFGGDGWLLESVMQAVHKLQVPVALATAASYGLYVTIPRRYHVLFYWWTPDAAFVDLGPRELMLPGNLGVWSQARLSKWAQRGLAEHAHEAYALASRMTLSRAAIDEMLLEVKVHGRNVSEVACNWLRANRGTWSSWVSLETACPVGQGIVAANGSFVSERVAAAGCSWCTAGRASELLLDELGSTYVCRECPPGRAQETPGMHHCEGCMRGRYSNESGRSSCLRCDPGLFQPGKLGTTCYSCPASMTTPGMGAFNVSECICPAGAYKAGSAGCVPCPAGFACEAGSDLENVPCQEGTRAPGSAPPWPRPLPKHVASCAAPLTSYRCRAVEACPGLAMKNCGPHLEGTVCGRCTPGFYFFRGKCKPCVLSGLTYVAVMTVLGIALAVVLAARKSSETLKPGLTDSVLSVAYIVMVEAQIIAILSMCEIEVVGTVEAGLAYSRTALEFLFAAADVGCVSSNFRLSFVLRVFQPLWGLLVFFLTYSCAWLLAKVWPAACLDWNEGFSHYGSLYLTFFIGIARHTVSLWHCYSHPGTERSLHDAPNILCGSKTWQDLVVVAVVGCLIFCCGFLALACYICYMAPAYFRYRIFRVRWRFLFVRYRPSTWWWGIVLLVRGSWLCLSIAVFELGASQLMWVQVMLTLYTCECLIYRPWYTLHVSFVDASMHLSLVLLCSFLFARASTDGNETYLVLMVSPVLAALAAAVCLCHSHGRPTSLEVLAEQEAQLRHVFSAASTAESLGRLLPLLPAADLQLLVQSGQLLQVDVLRESATPLGKWCTRLRHFDTSLHEFAPKSTREFAGIVPQRSSSSSLSARLNRGFRLHRSLPEPECECELAPIAPDKSDPPGYSPAVVIGHPTTHEASPMGPERSLRSQRSQRSQQSQPVA